MVARAAARRTGVEARCVRLAFDTTVVEVRCDDVTALDWLVEFVEPWFEVTLSSAEPGWRVNIDTDEARRTAVAVRPAGAGPRRCYRFDQQILELPGWSTGDGVRIADDERDLCVTVRPGRVAVHADPASLRWRFPLVWILTEIVASQLRRSCLDIHGAAVATGAGALLIVGPKGAGKTTLALELARSGGAALVANDRSFVAAGHPLEVRGVASVVKVRPETLGRFAELGAGLAEVPRPYLLALAELVAAVGDHPARGETAFTAAQVADRLGIGRVARAPLSAVLFPEIAPTVDGWDLDTLAPDRAARALAANLYGGDHGVGSATVFEDLTGGASFASAADVAALASSAPCHRVRLGPNAYDDAELAARLGDAAFGS